MAIFDPNKPLPEEVLQAMLKQSQAPEELMEIENQRKLAQLMGGGAFEYNPNLGRGTGRKAGLGGALGALGQTGQGYLYGTMQKRAMDQLAALKASGATNRETYLRGLYGQQRLPPDDIDTTGSYNTMAGMGLPY